MKKLYSIPIYTCKESLFNRDFEKKVQNETMMYYEPAISEGRISLTEASKRIEEGLWPKNIWEYNQIIGYIKIYLKECTIWFDLYIPNDKRIMRFGSKKHFVSLHQPNGAHFSLMGSNEEIRNKMRDFLKMVIEGINDNYFVDTSEFDALNELVDYSSLKE